MCSMIGVTISLGNDARLHLHHDQTITPEPQEATSNHRCGARLTTSYRWKLQPLSKLMLSPETIDIKPQAFPTIWNHQMYSLDFILVPFPPWFFFSLFNEWSITSLDPHQLWISSTRGFTYLTHEQQRLWLPKLVPSLNGILESWESKLNILELSLNIKCLHSWIIVHQFNIVGSSIQIH